MKYILSNDTVTVIVDGDLKQFTRDMHSNFDLLVKAILSDDETLFRKLSVSVVDEIKNWSQGKFCVVDGVIMKGNDTLPQELSDRLLEMIRSGENVMPLLNFWDRLEKNPSARSVEQLFKFLKHKNIPITSDGYFLAYKGIADNFLDVYTQKINNAPGAINEMPRNKISDDPNIGCHFGFHVGSLEYATGFAPVVVVCKVDPADVVCVPYDFSHQKVRVCKYEVMGFHSEPLPSTTIADEDIFNYSECNGCDECNGCNEFDDGCNEFDECEDDCIFYHDDNVDGNVVDANKHEFDLMDAAELRTMKLEDLRRYASKNLKIVGAYKLLGGKDALVKAIIKVRNWSK